MLPALGAGGVSLQLFEFNQLEESTCSLFLVQFPIYVNPNTPASACRIFSYLCEARSCANPILRLKGLFTKGGKSKGLKSKDERQEGIQT